SAQDAHAVGRSLGEADLFQACGIDGGAVVEAPLEVANVDDQVIPGPGSLAETALRNTAEERHLAALEARVKDLGARAGILALAAAARGLAVPAADATANALLELALVNAQVHRAQIH